MNDTKLLRTMTGRATLFLALVLGATAHADDPSVAPAKTVTEGGAQTYEHICQGCHMPNAEGAVGAGRYPKLAGDPALGSWQYTARTVLNGKHDMPAFGLPGDEYSGFLKFLEVQLTDAQVADVVNYVRTHFGNHYKDTVTADQVAALPHPGKPAPAH